MPNECRSVEAVRDPPVRVDRSGGPGAGCLWRTGDVTADGDHRRALQPHGDCRTADAATVDSGQSAVRSSTGSTPRTSSSPSRPGRPRARRRTPWPPCSRDWPRARTSASASLGLASALGPDVSLTVNSIQGNRADIDITIGPPGPSARRLPLAVGQIVLSLTSVPGVDSVWLMSGGTPIEAPLPDGALTARPLTAQDFTALVPGGAASPTGRAT